MGSKKSKEEKVKLIVDIVVLAAVWLFLLSYFKPELILSDTTASGGDMGSHNYLAKYMASNLAQGKVIGYSHDWYGGLPMFQYYFPAPYILMALLGTILNSNVAFKLITILGTFLMPLCVYAAFRIMDFKFPTPAIAAIMTLPFLFLESNSMYGANIPSTLAGEFSFSISMALLLVFMALLYQGVKTKKDVALNIVLLSVIVLEIRDF